jgi:hypothetical protein
MTSGAVVMSNSMALGNQSSLTASNQVRIGNVSVTSIGGYQGWSNLSDARFKSNIQEDVAGLDFIMALRPVTYTLNVDSLNRFLSRPDVQVTSDAGTQVRSGFLAQEVEQAAETVGYDFSGIDKPKNDSDHYALRYAEFVVPLVQAMQEQQAEIDALKQQIEILKTLVAQSNP